MAQLVPPVPLEMDLARAPGVVIRQEAQVLETVLQAAGLPYEAQNKYRVLPLPPGKTVAVSQNQADLFIPHNEELKSAPTIMYIDEESSCCCRLSLAIIGCLHLRPLKLHVYQNNAEMYTVDRPYRCGACLCNPQELSLYDTRTRQLLGQVVEQPCYQGCLGFSNCICRCTTVFYLLEAQGGAVLAAGGGPAVRSSLVHKYSLKYNACCCGRENNCCGATCCKPNMIFDFESTEGKLVSTVQKTYGQGGCPDFCRCLNQFDTYLVGFPADAPVTMRALMLSSVMLLEYYFYESAGGNTDN